MEIPKPSWLHRLQGLDDGAKQKIMIAATIVVMIVVIWLWVAYFNTVVVSGATQ